MIQEILECIESDMNEYFISKLPNITNNEKKVVLSNIVNQDGTIAVAGSDKVILSLYNIEKESVLNGGMGSASSSFSSGGNNPLNLNIFIVFTAYFSSSNYSQALMFISYVIGYFQMKNSFTRANTPSLARISSNVDKLIFEISTLNSDQTNSLWASFGAKHMPFIMYKVRTLSFDESTIREYRPAISTLGNN